MITAGIDVGTKDSCVMISEDGRIIDYIFIEDLKDEINEIIRFLRDHSPQAIACGFGYGLPVKRLSELNDRVLTLLTLSFDRPIMGVRLLIEALRKYLGEISYTIPSVKLLPTVPAYRKLNKIDMGTSDKVCSVALALVRLKEMGINFTDQNFVLVEAGYGFNSFIAVKDGKIVDGLGGTSGFPSFSSSGALDLEVVALLKDYPKEMVFRGGFKDFLKCEIDEIPDEALRWMFEYIVKGIKVMEVSIGKCCQIVVSGRFFDLYYDEFVDYTGFKCFKLSSVKASAEGACIIANGLNGGVFRDVVDHLELLKASGSILDYIAHDLRKLFKYPI
ncbi:DUF1464 family protein [Archaeoglobus profundus]|uniref:Butyrate kinase-like protein n=1 Tax=Archaeoglobus profundus (strain DSM 5631 / JCM 9629 / NBRC 100127 / Av18) TaxID=572546 RepID=D2RF14_ARCPA|nr:DUF1464 family protein [Archaeoglobus profundus]ADB58708.1 butyrate kinase-like protein [Archaeoglobus profundus DSM 5631]